MVKDGVEAFLLAVKRPGAEDGVEHLFGAGGVLDDRPFGRQVPLEDGDAPAGAEGVIRRADDILRRQMEAPSPVRKLHCLPAAAVVAVLL